MALQPCSFVCIETGFVAALEAPRFTYRMLYIPILRLDPLAGMTNPLSNTASYTQVPRSLSSRKLILRGLSTSETWEW
jgi:hypothetical protein